MWQFILGLLLGGIIGFGTAAVLRIANALETTKPFEEE